MLDNNLLQQLTGIFKDIDQDITLAVDLSEHASQSELVAMLTDIASTTPRIQVQHTTRSSVTPRFTIRREGRETGIAFEGIPGGHEFSSLVLALLNSAGKGKLPDEVIVRRIRGLRKNLSIKTYISLTCENCPDVVQALNQIVLLHGSMQHTMVDGGFVPDELERLKIQGVPSVIIDDQLIHSGRATLLDLLTRLESAYSDGSHESAPQDLGEFDVAVIGGGPAGVAAAIYSVRKGLKTALIAERLGGQMQETKGIENMVSVLYTEGPQLSAAVDQHLRSYPVQVLEHRRVTGIVNETLKSITLSSSETLTAKSIIVATGAKWRELGVPGEKEYLGRGVAFCPHCDGPYYKGKKVAVVGGGNSGVEAAIDLAGICQEVVLLEFGEQLKADAILIQKLKSLPNLSVVTQAQTLKINGNGEKVVSLTYQHRGTQAIQDLELDGVFVQIGLSPNSEFIKNLVGVNRFGEIVVDDKGRTSANGIYAAGDVTTTPFKQIVIAMGEGAKVALAAYEDRLRRA